MTQEISYRLNFSFPEDDDEREQMLPSVDQFLRTLEKADRMLAGCLGLDLEYRRALREMGESHFFYKVTLTLGWPRQILLGAWPRPEALRDWMRRVRTDLLARIPDRRDSDEVIAGHWNDWARDAGLADSLVYTPPPADSVQPLLGDLERTVTTLGGMDAIILE